MTVDYFSIFWEIDFLKNQKPTTVIRKRRSQFARYGIPDIVMSDNGPHFSCKEFANFAIEYEFQHTMSSPNYPQSNGKVEQAVKSAKRIVKRARSSKQDVYLSLLDCRNTPTEGILSSPAQRLMCRRTKSRLQQLKLFLNQKSQYLHMWKSNTTRIGNANTTTEPPRTYRSWNKDSAFGYPQNGTIP